MFASNFLNVMRYEIGLEASVLIIAVNWWDWLGVRINIVQKMTQFFFAELQRSMIDVQPWAAYEQPLGFTQLFYLVNCSLYTKFNIRKEKKMAGSWRNQAGREYGQSMFWVKPPHLSPVPLSFSSYSQFFLRFQHLQTLVSPQESRTSSYTGGDFTKIKKLMGELCVPDGVP